MTIRTRRTGRARLFDALVIGLVGLLVTTQALAMPAVALVTDLEGRVEVRTEARAEWSNAWLDQNLKLDTGVRTWDSSNAELRFVDGSVLMLSQRTRLQITTALFDAAAAPPEIRVALKQGGVDIRAGRTPLRVTAKSGATHRFEPGERGHIRVVGAGPRASLLVGQPRMTASVDIEPLINLSPQPAPADAGPEPEDDPDRPFGQIPRIVGEMPMLPAGPFVAVEPEDPPTAPMLPGTEPDPEAPAPPQVRVQVEIRAGGE